MATAYKTSTGNPTVNKQLNAMLDSVDLINRFVAANNTSLTSRNTVRRNVQHLNQMLRDPQVVASGVDLSVYTTAVNAGNAWLGKLAQTTLTRPA